MVAAMSDLSQRLVWVDLEMTGLDPATCAIVEIATLITDGDLNLVASGPNIVIHQPEQTLLAMNDFVRELHTRSGLLEQIRESTIDLATAEAQTLAFIERHSSQGTAVLAGNSVWKDRAFLEAYMPRVIGHLHYRMIDVSTIKELVRRWYPTSYAAPAKKERHRALDDIEESIEELRHYRARVFTPPMAE